MFPFQKRNEIRCPICGRLYDASGHTEPIQVGERLECGECTSAFKVDEDGKTALNLDPFVEYMEKQISEKAR